MKAEPQPNYDVNRASGTDSDNGCWLRRLVRQHGRHLRVGLQSIWGVLSCLALQKTHLRRLVADRDNQHGSLNHQPAGESCDTKSPNQKHRLLTKVSELMLMPIWLLTLWDNQEETLSVIVKKFLLWLAMSILLVPLLSLYDMLPQMSSYKTKTRMLPNDES